MADGILSRIGDAVSSPVAQGLLGAAAFGFNPALGLLAAPALRTQRERAQMENQAAREQLKQQQRARTAMQQLPRAMGSAPPTLLDPQTGQAMAQPGAQQQYQQRMMGLLGQIAPQDVARGVLGTMMPGEQRAAPSDIRTMQALGLPLTAEGYQQFQQMQGGDIDDLLKRLQAEEIISERERAAEDRQQEGAREQMSISQTLNRGEEMLNLNEQLEGTWLEPGRFGAEERAPLASLFGEIAGGFGFDETSERQQQNVDASAKFKKASADFVIGIMDRMEGNVSNMKLQQIRDASAGLGTSPAANRAIVGNILETTLQEADIGNIDLGGERERFEALLERIKGGGSAPMQQQRTEPSAQGQQRRQSQAVDLGDGVTLEFD